MEILYTTSATSVGGRNGHVKSRDGYIDVDLRTPGPMGGPGGGTTPEDLFASGYSACFNSALGAAMRMKKVKPASETTIQIEVSLGKTEAGAFQLAAKISGRIPGVERKLAEELMREAHQICPYSRATRGNIDVELAVIE